MRSYCHLLYRVEDSVVNNKAIQTYSAWLARVPACYRAMETWDRDRWSPRPDSGATHRHKGEENKTKKSLNKKVIFMWSVNKTNVLNRSHIITGRLWCSMQFKIFPFLVTSCRELFSVRPLICLLQHLLSGVISYLHKFPPTPERNGTKNMSSGCSHRV